VAQLGRATGWTSAGNDGKPRVRVSGGGADRCLIVRNMKAYVITTGTVFGLLTLAHIWRALAEGPHLATDPSFVLITVAAAGLCVWACRVLKLSSRS
jgi:hypothetical protein